MIKLGNMNITQWWLVAAVGGLSLVLELVAKFWPQYMPLISPVMRKDGLRWMTWPAIFGLLPGHFWSPKWLAFTWLKPYAAPLLVMVILTTVVYDFVGRQLTMTEAFCVVPIYYLLGAILWNQTL